MTSRHLLKMTRRNRITEDIQSLFINTLTHLIALFLVASLGCAEDTETPTEAPPETPILTVPEIAEIALKSTLVLDIKKTNGKWLKASSGFVVKEGTIVTAYHVIKDMTTGSTARVIGQAITYPIESVLAVDEPHDIAILRSNALAPPLPLGNSDTVRIGETVYVTGHPDGYIGSFSTGVVAAIRPGDELVADKVLQITAPVSAGSSGGPVLNAQGDVIGILNGNDSDGQLLNFAVPVNFLKTLLAGL